MTPKIHNGPRFIRQPQVEAWHKKMALLEFSKDEKSHPCSNRVGVVAVKSGLTVPHDGPALKEEGVDGIHSPGESIFGVDCFPEVLQSLILCGI